MRIYAHFASKVELLAEVCARGIASTPAALDGVLTTVPGSPRVQSEEVGKRFVTAVLDSQRYIAIFAREKRTLPRTTSSVSGTCGECSTINWSVLDEGVAAGEFLIAGTRIAALAIGGMVSWAYV